MKRIILSVAAMLLAIAEAQAACTVSTSGVAFGAFNPLPGLSSNTTGTIAVTCSGLLITFNYTITIATSHGSFAARKMVSGTDNLIYNLYTDSAFTHVWGDGTASTSTVSDSISFVLPGSVTRNYVVYGQIASGQNTAKAHPSYADTPVVTITY